MVALAARHGCVTVPDLVAARFGEGWPRGLAASAVVGGGVATLAVQVAGVAVVAEVLLGLPGWQTALLATLATTVYTAAGGMRAGLLAEAAQGLIMVVAAVALAWAGLAAAGGPGAAVATLHELRPELLEPWPAAGATSSLGLFLLFGLGTCAQPHYLQKFLVLRDARALRWLPLVMTGALLAILTVWLGLGLGGTALWLRGELMLARPDELAPRLIGLLARPDLRWLTVAAVLAAVMSTAATLLNLVAAALTRDLPRACGRALPSSLTSARVATVAAAALAAALALATERPVALLGILGWGTFTAALLPVMVVGLAWPGATRQGAVAALVVGPLVQLGLEAARLAGVPLSAIEPGLTGAAVGCLALVAGSLARSGSRPAACAASAALEVGQLVGDRQRQLDQPGEHTVHVVRHLVDDLAPAALGDGVVVGASRSKQLRENGPRRLRVTVEHAPADQCRAPVGGEGGGSHRVHGHDRALCVGHGDREADALETAERLVHLFPPRRAVRPAPPLRVRPSPAHRAAVRCDNRPCGSSGNWRRTSCFCPHQSSSRVLG